ncbi:helix-turn-helix transcriptional regulator [Actinomadura scrupuli]|uniref:helix-turn-helix transcriptional regulator n=1 Tax=Actinomadura scrupuli TaxID=559629 RepID=UPI003D97F444
MDSPARPQWHITLTSVGFVSPEQLAALADETGWTVTAGIEPHTTEIVLTSALDDLRAAIDEAFTVVGRATAGLDLERTGVRACPWSDPCEPPGGAARAVPLVAVAEVAEILGVSPARVHLLAERKDFPEPQYELATGKLWPVSDIYHFDKIWDRGPDRPGANA